MKWLTSMVPLLRDLAGLGMGGWCIASQITSPDPNQWVMIVGGALLAPATATAAVRLWRGSPDTPPGPGESSPPSLPSPSSPPSGAADEHAR